MVASADLGGLGANKGAPVTYAYTIPSLMPQLLPWFFLLLLLALKSNRTAQAWWIFLPMACPFGVEWGMQTFLSGVGSEPLEMFGQMIDAAAVGLATVWLLAPGLSRKHRFVTFLCILFTLSITSVLAYGVRQDWNSGDREMVTMFAMYVAIFTAALAVALGLTAFSCRRRYTPLRFVLWLSLWLVAAYSMVMLPVILMAWLGSNQPPPWMEVIMSTLVAAAISLAMFLPFLLLLFANPFYRSRLKRLLRLGEFAQPRQDPPPVAAVDAAPPIPPIPQ